MILESGTVTQSAKEYLRGYVCDPKDFLLSSNSSSPLNSTVTCLTRKESLGLTVAAEAAVVSLIAVVWIFWYILRNVAKHMYRKPVKEWSFIQDPMDILMLSLFVADLFQALGSVLDVKWISEGTVYIGPVCTAQGVLQQLGETGVAITTLFIAVYTFLVIFNVSGQKASRRSLAISSLLVFLSWLFLIVMIILGVTNQANHHREVPYFEPTPFWCWIGNHEYNLVYKIIGEYVWFWLTLASSLMLYFFLALWSRGNIRLSDTSRWRMSFFLDRSKNDEDRAKRPKPWVMLAYPLTYSLVILPLSVVRWATFVDGDALGNAEGTVTLVVTTIFRLSGVFNVVLLMKTRPNTTLFRLGEEFDHVTKGRAPSPSLAESAEEVEMGTTVVGEAGVYGSGRPRLPSLSDDDHSSTYSYRHA